MYMSVMPTNIAVHQMPGACGGQITALNPLELELLTVVSHHVGTKNSTEVLSKNKGS